MKPLDWVECDIALFSAEEYMMNSLLDVSGHTVKCGPWQIENLQILSTM